eukprot:m.195798 g.195798  ORF g.195798 m.195798 type:complete len:648 (+) comp14899_c1_seq5:2470-4413(+)
MNSLITGAAKALSLPSRLLRLQVRSLRYAASHLSEHASEPSSDITPNTNANATQQNQKPNPAVGILHKDNIQAEEGFNRWKLVPPAVATHICLGSMYAWSLLNSGLTREIGVVAPTAGDWGLSDCVPVFSTICVFHGLSAAVVGKWQERVGARHAGTIGALTFGGGFVLGSLGVYLHNLPLLYGGFGVISGIGVGLAYVPPVSTLIRWFPDKRGLVTGLTVMGFGGGALIAGPAMNILRQKFQQAPTYLGTTDEVASWWDGTKQVAEVAGEVKQVVVATTNQLAVLDFPEVLREGVYLAGSGDTGIAGTLATLGLAYTGVMAWSAFSLKSTPDNYSPPVTASSQGAVGKLPPDVHIDKVMKTPQFWLVWTTFGFLAATGMGVVSVAKDMIADVFAQQLPHTVTLGFASGYVLALSGANLLGRLVWAAMSDKIGTKPMFAVFTALGIPLYASLPLFIDSVVSTHSVTPLYAYCASTLLLFSFFGGAYSCVPSYEASLFGSKYVGAVHGRMLTASAMGGLIGPLAFAQLRYRSEVSAIRDLTSQVDANVFSATFGSTKAEVDTLIANNSISIQRLMDVLPDSVQDPTPFLYNDALYAASALLVVAAASNILTRPVNPKHWMSNTHPETSVETENIVNITSNNKPKVATD